jgi:tryptophan synthase beta chain
MPRDQVILVNLSGRGDKDVASAARHVFGEELKF